MRDKNQNNTQKTQAQKAHVFEIHTMASDNEVNKNPNKQVAPAVTSQKAQQTSATAPFAAKKMQQLPTVNTGEKKSNKKPAANPFLAESNVAKKEEKKASFAPGKKENPVEKINYKPADIAPKKDLKQAPEKKQKKMMHMVMIIFIIIFLVGAVGFGIFMLKSNQTTQQNQNDVQITDDFVLNDEAGDEALVEDVAVNQIETMTQMYSTDITNYISIDVESQITEMDIASELESIAINMKKDDMDGPVSFIVTDKNSNPISFNIFAMSASMDISQDILLALEEDFEIYAYNDGANGIRFGFAVDTKNTETLQTALTTNEATLPMAFDLILDGFGKSVIGAVFGDGVYETHPIRYYNLDTDEIYSVDYTINDKRFIIGTTKDTIRAIIDYSKNTQATTVPNFEMEY